MTPAMGPRREWERQPWMEQAACKEHPTTLFFPAPSAQRQMERAKAVCRTCPVMYECRAFAFTFGIGTLFGVWGGMSERQRNIAMRRKQEPTYLPLPTWKRSRRRVIKP